MRKHLPKTLGLSLLAALSLMAFAATSAQAGEIQVGGLASLATGDEVTGAQEGEGKLLVPGLSIEIVCQSATIKGKIISGPLGTASAEIIFPNNCVVYPINPTTKALTSLTPLPCTVAIDPAKGEGGVVLHEGDTYLLATSAVGVPFTTVKFSGEECTLTPKNEIKGSQVFKVVTGDLNLGPAVLEPLLEASDAIQELLKDELLFGKNKAFLMASGKVKISAPAADVGKLIGAR